LGGNANVRRERKLRRGFDERGVVVERGWKRMNEDLVRSAYRVLLGRDPENETVIQRLATPAADSEAILRAFVECNEFKERFGDLPSVKGSMGGGFTYSDDMATSRVVLKALRMLRPHKAAGFSKIRVGRQNDGGYVMLDDFSGISAAYSLGISDDVSWDLQMADHGMTIYMYDHTIPALPASHSRFRWGKVGIGEAYPERNLKPLHVLRVCPETIHWHC
jgi:hypothetical protein